MNAYVCSTGRCGSLSLARWFDAFTPCVMEPGEHIGTVLFATRIQRGRPATELAMRVLLRYGRFKRGRISHHHDGVTETAIHPAEGTAAEKALWVDHAVANCPDIIEEECPGAKYVWLIRNGWDCVSSMMAWKWYRPDDDMHDLDIYAHNRIQGPWTGEMTGTLWRSLTLLGRCCWYWSWCNRWIDRQLRAVPEERKFFLRLEDWSDDTAKRLCAFLKVDPPTDLTLPRSHAGKWNDLRPTWNAAERRMFWHFCEDSMRKWYPEPQYGGPGA